MRSMVEGACGHRSIEHPATELAAGRAPSGSLRSPPPPQSGGGAFSAIPPYSAGAGDGTEPRAGGFFNKRRRGEARITTSIISLKSSI
jgi:hypothetical protein